jgi:hypothetical protein
VGAHSSSGDELERFETVGMSALHGFEVLE